MWASYGCSGRPKTDPACTTASRAENCRYILVDVSRWMLLVKAERVVCLLWHRLQLPIRRSERNFTWSNFDALLTSIGLYLQIPTIPGKSMTPAKKESALRERAFYL